MHDAQHHGLASEFRPFYGRSPHGDKSKQALFATKDNLMGEIESFLNDDPGLKLSGFGCQPERCAV